MNFWVQKGKKNLLTIDQKVRYDDLREMLDWIMFMIILIDTNFFPQDLNAEVMKHFYEKRCLLDVSLEKRHNILYYYDGSSALYHITVHWVEWWTGRGGPNLHEFLCL